MSEKNRLVFWAKIEELTSDILDFKYENSWTRPSTKLNPIQYTPFFFGKFCLLIGCDVKVGLFENALSFLLNSA